MSIRLLQTRNADGVRELVFTRNRGVAWRLKGIGSTLALAQRAIEDRVGLLTAIAEHDSGEIVDLEAAFAEDRVLAPVDHPDPAHLLLTRSGGHAGVDACEDGVNDGRPIEGEIGTPPDWFYQGDGQGIAAHGAGLSCPEFAETAEMRSGIAGIYVNGSDGIPYRLGFALAGYVSRSCEAALGGELLTGVLPGGIRGSLRSLRGHAVVSEAPFLAGEDHMAHSIANLEHHHFRHEQFRRAGDVHVHLFDTGTAAAIRMQPHDGIGIAAGPFRYPWYGQVERRGRLEAVAARRMTVEVL